MRSKFLTAAIVLGMLSALALTLAIPMRVSAGGILLWADLDNDHALESGEQIAGGWLYYQKWGTGNVVARQAGLLGGVTYINAKQGDKLFSQHAVYAHAAVKPDRGFAGSMFDLTFDTDFVSLTGVLSTRTLAQMEVYQLNNGGTLLLRLDHPIFSWNLVVALNWNADTAYLNKLKTGFTEASKYMFDVTDGQMKFGRIDIRNNVAEDSSLWKTDADITICNGEQWPCASIDGVKKSMLCGVGSQVHLPRYFNGRDCDSGDPDKRAYVCSIVHESGHYIMAFRDEYIDGDKNYTAWLNYRAFHPGEAPNSYGLMDNPYTLPEMSSVNDYREASFYIGKTADTVTNQIWYHTLYMGGTHRPCWQHFYKRFDNSAGQQMLWRGYEGIRFAISMPLAGIFQGRNAQGQEIRTSPDRDGPVGIPTTFGRLTIRKVCEFAPGLVGAAEAVDPTPAPQQKAEYVNPAGTGPKLLLDAGISGSSEIEILQIKVISDQPLYGAPTVYVRPDFGSQVSVPMTYLSGNIYQGSVDVGDAMAGSVNVTANGSGGQTHISSTFRIERLTPDMVPEIIGPRGWMEAGLPDGTLSQEVMWVTMGSGNQPIPPTEPSMRVLDEPVSFHLQDGVYIGSIWSLNWRFAPATLVGRNSTSTNLRRYDSYTCSWVTASSTTKPGYRILSGSTLSEGIYAACAMESTDTTSPGTISYLTAQTGQTQKSVMLSWMATGDDAGTGTAARYHVWFSKEPITPENLSQCSELSIYATPQSAWQFEQFGFEMPEPDTLYYFAVQAQDESENIGPISDCVNAVSYVQDTDADGLPDQWEEAYGLDPNNPGDESLDTDDDGLTNLQEYQIGTIPTDPDTDMDGLSDGLEVTAGTGPLDVADPLSLAASGAKQQDDGVKVGCPTLVTTAAFAENVNYGQDLDGSAGIRLEDAAIPRDREIEVIGTTGTTAEGERRLSGCVYREKEPLCALPVALINRAVVGGDLGSQPGIAGRFELNNIGLLVQTWGRVIEVGSDYVVISDGLLQGNAAAPVRVSTTELSDPPDLNEYVTVIGISSLYKPGDDRLRLVLPRDDADIGRP